MNNLHNKYKVFLILLTIGIISCGNKNIEIGDKEYKLILIQKRFNNIRYDLIDSDDDTDKVLIEDSGVRLFSSIGIYTSDSIFIYNGFDFQDNQMSSALYTMQKLGNDKLIVRCEESDSRDSLLISLDNKKKALIINENKYFLDEISFKDLSKEGLDNMSIISFADFINNRIDDFYSFHTLAEYRWINGSTFPEYKTLKAEIKTKHPQNDDIFFNWVVNYVYNNNDLTEILKYDDNNEEYYHLKYVEKTLDYSVYKYNYNDDISRSYAEGSVYIDNKNMKDSTYSSVRSNQRGQVDETLSKIIQRKEYTINKLNLSKEEIQNIIGQDLVIIENDNE